MRKSKRSSFFNRKKSRRQPVRKSRRKTTKKHSLKKSVRNKSRRRRSKSNRKKNDGTKKWSAPVIDLSKSPSPPVIDLSKSPSPPVIDLSESSPTEENRIIEEKRREGKRKLSTHLSQQENSERKKRFKNEETKKVCHMCTAVNDISAEKCEVCATYLIQEGCLQNLGQTCYLNATIQMMRDIRKCGLTFIDYPETSELSEIINDFIYLVKNDNSNTEKLENVTGIFKDYKNEQQDPSEFLSKIEEYLKLMNELLFTETSIFNNRVSSRATNSSFLLSLEIPASANNIGSCYEKYIEKVHLEDYKDEETGILGGYKKIINNFSKNKFLIIQLKRFSNKGKKLRRQITPEERLSFSSVDFDNIDDIKTVNYKLIGVIIHIGDRIKSGHYTYYSYINQMLYDDHTKTEIKKDNKSLKEKLDKNGYIFLYQKVDKEEGCVIS
jgi:ubiquitin C-terminal hydrolase